MILFNLFHQTHGATEYTASLWVELEHFRGRVSIKIEYNACIGLSCCSGPIITVGFSIRIGCHGSVTRFGEEHHLARSLKRLELLACQLHVIIIEILIATGG